MDIEQFISISLSSNDCLLELLLHVVVLAFINVTTNKIIISVGRICEESERG